MWETNVEGFVYIIMPSIYNSPDCGKNRQYTFRPIQCKTFTFQVKANANVNICLSPTPSETPYQQYEIFLAGWSGGESGIRRNKKDDVQKVKTPNLLHSGQFRGFWISVGNHAIKVGKEGQAVPFLVHKDPVVKLDFSYYGYCTSYGTTGQWTFADDDYAPGFDMGSIGDAISGFFPPPQPGPAPPPYYPPAPAPAPPTTGAMRWVPCQALAMCPSPVSVAPGVSNSYVAIAYHNGGLIPGNVSAPHLNVCHVPWGGQVHAKTDFFLLSNPANMELAWQPASRGAIPVGAIQGGYSETGERLYIGRHRQGGTFISGKVHPSHAVCYVPRQGREISNPSYEVLCLKTVPLSLMGM